MRPFPTLLAALLPLSPLFAEPSWIWMSKAAKDADKMQAKVEFQVQGEIKAATLWLACDNGADASVNNKPALKNPDWQEPTQVSVKDFLRKGKNEIVVDARNQGGSAGLIARLTIEKTDGTKQVVETGADWKVAPTGSVDFKPAVVLGKHGAAPWGNVLGNKPGKGGRGDSGGSATAVEDITVPEGFKVELIYNVPKPVEGSWVGLTPDGKGRLFTCDQYGQIYRLTPPGILGATTTLVQRIETPLTGAHGLLWAHNSLYVMVNENQNSGLHRLWDAEDDGKFEKAVQLAKIRGSGEHGTHSMVLGADSKTIFFCIGNHSELPENLSRMRMADAWAEDHVLPRLWDANGHARGRLAPGGMIFKMDPDGKDIELWSGGYRNEFDLAVDPNGDVFTYDADMEWDIGSPWYRPTRYNHAPSGADAGWRSGSGKWPEAYPDSLPGLVNLGPGSPTGLAFGTGAKFPAKYQRALYGNDWTYGTMYAAHLTPEGGSFAAVKEEFIFAKPLPLTDVVINPVDGAMYFAIGGRRTQSAVYRVTYVGKESTAPVPALPLTAEAKLRKELEKLQDAGVGPEAVAKAWPHLGHADRFVRFAARVAIEKQPVASWMERALQETSPVARIEALIALARLGQSPEARQAALAAQKIAGVSTGPVFAALPQDAALQGKILASLGGIDFAKLDLASQFALLRAYQLAFTRLGKPAAAQTAPLAAKLDALYPQTNARLNQELCQLLVLLDSPKVVAKTLGLMAVARDDSDLIATDGLLERNTGYASAANSAHKSRPNRQQLAYLFALRHATAGWTPELRKSYFGWFPLVRSWRGGNSFKGFNENIRKEALATFVPEAEKTELDALSQKDFEVASVKVNPPAGPGKSYTVDDVVKVAEGRLKGRDFASGKNLYSAVMCATCHLFGGEGGNIGPDLTGAGNRYSIRDLAENIIEPSKVISDIYDSHQITLKDGSILIGRIVVEQAGNLMVMTNPFAPSQLASVPSAQVAEKKALAQSIMPPSLINALNEDELLDLIAFLRSGGNAQDAMFKK